MLDCVEEYKLINGYDFSQQLAEMLDLNPSKIRNVLNDMSWGNQDYWNFDDLEYCLIDRLVEYIPYNPDEEEQEGFNIESVKVVDDESKICVKMYELLKSGEIPNYFILMKNW